VSLIDEFVLSTSVSSRFETCTHCQPCVADLKSWGGLTVSWALIEIVATTETLLTIPITSGGLKHRGVL